MTEQGSTHHHQNKASKLITSTFGILVGLAGIEHGIFEILQGDVATNGFMINAIGDSYRFWEGTSERALTILPTFLLAGISAVILGVIVTIWSSLFVQRRFLLILTLTLFLVGGGMAPIILSLFAVIVATRIDKPLTWWRTHLSSGIRSSLGKLWPWALLLFVIIFWGTVGVQIFGLPLETALVSTIVGILSVAMVTLIPLSVIIGLSYDTSK